MTIFPLPEAPLRAQSAMTTITRTVCVAAGVFAPGHLGELTQYLPFELVDDVLEQTRTVQRRLRELPSRVGVYFVLTLGLFPAFDGCNSAPRSAQPADRDETSLARRLLRRLGPGMLVLLDRRFDANAFFADIAATGAMLLARAQSPRRPPVLRHLPDLTVTGSDGTRVRESSRLITTLLDPYRYPAHALIQLSHERLGDRAGLSSASSHPAAGTHPALGRSARPGAGNLGPTHRLPTAAHGHGHRRRNPPGHRPRPGQLHHRPARRERPAHQHDRRLRRGAHRPARRDRTSCAGHPAARTPAPLQRPQGHMHHQPLPRPQRHPSRHPNHRPADNASSRS
ncbi:MAG: transposase domain-containing protein [Pseudonocardiales bacterium]|nr:transposase domain-containing protein [Pseudonocardiales bacterium]